MDESPKPKSKHDGSSVWACWHDLHTARGLKPPVALKPDVAAGKELSKHVEAADVKRVLTAYLDDADPFLPKQAHPLRLLAGRLNAYMTNPEDEMQLSKQIAALAKREAKKGGHDVK